MRAGGLPYLNPAAPNMCTIAPNNTPASAAVLIESGIAGGQAKVAARLCAVVQEDSDGRSYRPAIAGRIRHTEAEFDANMTAYPLATGGFLAASWS